MPFDPCLDDLEAHIMAIDWPCPECGTRVRAADLEDLRHHVSPQARSDEGRSELGEVRRA